MPKALGKSNYPLNVFRLREMEQERIFLSHLKEDFEEEIYISQYCPDTCCWILEMPDSKNSLKVKHIMRAYSSFGELLALASLSLPGFLSMN